MSSLNNLIRLANSYLNPDTSSMEGFRKYLISWYVIKFNTNFKDPALLDHTFEELLFLYLFHDLRESPEKYQKVLGNKEADDYEDWLKKQMGDDYVSEEEMAAQAIEYEKRIQEIAKTLPDKITTDFSQFGDDHE